MRVAAALLHKKLPLNRVTKFNFNEIPATVTRASRFLAVNIVYICVHKSFALFIAVGNLVALLCVFMPRVSGCLACGSSNLKVIIVVCLSSSSVH